MAYRFRNIIGTNVCELREQKGYTQNEFAARLQLLGLVHLDRGGLSKIEAGTRSVYDYELALIAEALGVTSGSLFPTVKAIRSDIPRLIASRHA